MPIHGPRGNPHMLARPVVRRKVKRARPGTARAAARPAAAPVRRRR